MRDVDESRSGVGEPDDGSLLNTRNQPGRLCMAKAIASGLPLGAAVARA